MIDYFSSFPSWTTYDYAVDMIENHGFAVELWEKSSVRKAGQKGPRGKGRQANRFENSLDLERYTFTDLTEIGISMSEKRGHRGPRCPGSH